MTAHDTTKARATSRRRTGETTARRQAQQGRVDPAEGKDPNQPRASIRTTTPSPRTTSAAATKRASVADHRPDQHAARAGAMERRQPASAARRSRETLAATSLASRSLRKSTN